MEQVSAAYRKNLGNPKATIPWDELKIQGRFVENDLCLSLTLPVKIGHNKLSRTYQRHVPRSMFADLNALEKHMATTILKALNNIETAMSLIEQEMPKDLDVKLRVKDKGSVYILYFEHP